jgi:hypothetical protein
VHVLQCVCVAVCVSYNFSRHKSSGRKRQAINGLCGTRKGCPFCFITGDPSLLNTGVFQWKLDRLNQWS